MIQKERDLLGDMKRLANTGALNDELPSFDLAVNDCLRRLGLLNDNLKQAILTYKSLSSGNKGQFERNLG